MPGHAMCAIGMLASSNNPARSVKPKKRFKPLPGCQPIRHYQTGPEDGTFFCKVGTMTPKKEYFTASDPHHDISKQAKPLYLFSGILRDLVVSCPLLSIAPVTSFWGSRTQTCQWTTWVFSDNKHAKTCPYTTWQKCLSKQDINRAVDHLNIFGNQICQNMPEDRLSEVFEQTWQKHSSAPLEALSDTKRAKTCQDTICQTYLSKQKSNMAV